MVLSIIMYIVTGFIAFIFTINITALNKFDRAIGIHREMPKKASKRMVNEKVIITFITGVSYITAIFGMIFSIPAFLWIGVIGSGLFVLFYIIEVIAYSRIYPKVWGGFLSAGLLCLWIGIYCILKIKGV